MKFHIVKRDNCPVWKKCCLYLAAVLLALALGAVLLVSLGVDPIAYYTRMFTMGTIGNKIAYKVWINYLKEFVPLALVSVALSLAFKMRFWNIGGEGQFILGAISAAFVAFKLGPLLPGAVTLVLMCLAAILVAGLYGLFVAALKVKFGTNETLMTLMLNYVALYILMFLGETKADWNFFLDPESLRPVFASFSDLVSFPGIPLGGKFTLNICVILTVLVSVLVYIYLKYTKHGYEISVVGDSAGTARYAGMKVNRIVLRTVFLSAAMIGLAAAFKVGTAGILSTAITDDVGWTGIIVAWLSQLNTVIIFAVSALICVLHYGSTVAAATFSQVDSSFANMLQGVILFLVLAADFYTRFRIVPVKKGGN
nr:ABC transporter permease [Oscillospiraceae bacterium]